MNTSYPLTIAISAMGAQIDELHLPAPHPGIEYIIVVQKLKGRSLPVNLVRDDVHIEASDLIGLSNSRNTALALATNELLMFSDYDIILDLARIQDLAEEFDRDPKLTLALGWRAGQLPAMRSSSPYPINRYNSGHACVPGIMVRRADIVARNIQFDVNFGVGSRFPIGEDYIFVTDTTKTGARAVCFPIALGHHPDLSSGHKWRDPEIEYARRAVIKRVFGHLAPIMQIAYALKHRRVIPDPLRFAFSKPPTL